MFRLFNHSENIIGKHAGHFQRFIHNEIDHDSELTGIIGCHSSGRGELLLQLMKRDVHKERKVCFLDLSDPGFSVYTISQIAKEFYRHGGDSVYVDNIQRYQNAGSELLEVHSCCPDLRLVFSGSFIPEGLHWLKLSEKSSVYQLPGLSYREFIEHRYNYSFPLIQLDELLELNRNPGAVVLNRIRPLEYFNEYIQTGYYLSSKHTLDGYQEDLHSMINILIDSDMSAAWNLDNISTVKIRRLLMKLSAGGMYRPNIEKLAREIETTRDSLLKFISYAGRAGLIRIYYKNSIKKSGKPQMLYLDNPNLMKSLSLDVIVKEHLYEAFLFNQLSYNHDIYVPEEDRIIIDGKYSFQMAWKADKAAKMSPAPDYIIDPDIEYQSGSSLPLWMFGFLY